MTRQSFHRTKPTATCDSLSKAPNYVSAPYAKPDDATRTRMRANLQTDTGPELALRRALWAAGLRGYRLHRADLPGKPDIVFSRLRLALFVHGCFWHSCPTCNKTQPKRNATYWKNKFRRNVLRDQRNVTALKDLGWRVVVVWECQIRANRRCLVSRVTQLTAKKSRSSGST